MKKTPSLKKSILAGCVTSLSVFLAGFGVMCFLYNHWLQTDAVLYPGLKGLFDYKASSWGDAICLPLIIGAGTAYITYFKTRTASHSKAPVICGLLGALIGGIVQYDWIASDTTLLNWSIPVQHQFNLAGWWHAGFFVGVCFAVLYLAAYIFIIDIKLNPRKENAALIQETPVYSFYSVCQFIIWFCALLFIHFHFIDDYSIKYEEWKIVGFFSVLGIIFLLGGKLLINKSRKMLYYGPAIFAIILSAEVAMLIVLGMPKCNKWFFLCGLLCTAAYVHNSRNKLKMAGKFLIFVLNEFLCQTQISYYLTIENKVPFYTYLGICLLIPVCITFVDFLMIEKESDIDEAKGPFIRKFCFYSLLMNIIPLLLSHNQLDFVQQFIGDISIFLKSSFVSFVLFTLLILYIKLTFRHIQKMEYNVAKSTKEIENAKYSQYTVYGFIYVGAIVLLWNALNFKFNASVLNWFCIAATAVLIIFCFFIVNPLHAKSSLLLIYLAYFGIILYLLTTRPALSVLPPVSYIWANTIMTIYIACIMTIIVIAEMIYNIFLLRQIKTVGNITSIIVIGLLSSVCFGLAAYHLFIYRTISHAIQLTIVSLVSFCLLPYKFSWILNPTGNVGIINQTTRQAIIQDGFLYGIVANASIISSMAIFDCLFMNSTYLWKEAASIYVVYSLGLFPLCYYCLENNVQHKEKMAVDNPGNEKLTEQYGYLEKWLSIQNTLAILLSFPYSLYFYIFEWIKSPVKETKT